jgi:hypothetical protein
LTGGVGQQSNSRVSDDPGTGPPPTCQRSCPPAGGRGLRRAVALDVSASDTGARRAPTDAALSGSLAQARRVSRGTAATARRGEGRLRPNTWNGGSPNSRRRSVFWYLSVQLTLSLAPPILPTGVPLRSLLSTCVPVPSPLRGGLAPPCRKVDRGSCQGVRLQQRVTRGNPMVTRPASGSSYPLCRVRQS